MGKRILSVLLLLFLTLTWGAGCSKGEASVEDKLTLAVKYLSEHKYEEAVLAYEDVIEIAPKDGRGYKGLSVAYALQDKPDQAEKALQEGVQAAGSKDLELALAGFYLEQDKKDLVEPLYQQVLQQDPKFAQGQLEYSQWLNTNGRRDEAIALLERLQGEGNGTFQGLNALVSFYLETGNQEKAKQILDQSLALEPNQVAGYSLLMDLTNPEERAGLADTYGQKQPLVGSILKLNNWFAQGKYNEIVAYYGQLANDQKTSVRVKGILLMTYAKLAKADLQGAMAKEIDLAGIKDGALLADLARFYLDSGNKAMARTMALQGVELDGQNQNNYLVLYRSYLEEDPVTAKVWLYRYVLNSHKGVKRSWSALTNVGVLSLQELEKEVPSSMQGNLYKDVAESFLDFELTPDLSSSYHDFAYYDKANHIAYTSVFYTDLAFESHGYVNGPDNGFEYLTEHGFSKWLFTPENTQKPIIVRIHNPQIFSLEQVWPLYIASDPQWVNKVRNVTKWIQYRDIWSFYVGIKNSFMPVLYEGGPFEEIVRKAGLNPSDYIFIDIP